MENCWSEGPEKGRRHSNSAPSPRTLQKQEKSHSHSEQGCKDGGEVIASVHQMTHLMVVGAYSRTRRRMLMGSVLSCGAGRRSGAEVKRPKDAVAQEDCPHKKQRQDPQPRHPSPTESTVPPVHH